MKNNDFLNSMKDQYQVALIDDKTQSWQLIGKNVTFGASFKHWDLPDLRIPVMNVTHVSPDDLRIIKCKYLRTFGISAINEFLTELVKYGGSIISYPKTPHNMTDAEMEVDYKEWKDEIDNRESLIQSLHY